jgi:hypothetical protein
MAMATIILACMVYWYIRAGMRIRQAFKDQSIKRMSSHAFSDNGEPNQRPPSRAKSFIDSLQRVEVFAMDALLPMRRSSLEQEAVDTITPTRVDLQSVHKISAEHAQQRELERLARQLNYPQQPASEAFRKDGLYWTTLMKMQRFLFANLLVWIPSTTAVLLIQFDVESLPIAFVLLLTTTSTGTVIGAVYWLNIWTSRS